MQILKDNIRSRILDVAKQQFELKGYSKTSMREIAVDVGVGVGNIYNYFKSKDELFHEVVRPVLYALDYTDRSTELVKVWFTVMQRKYPMINIAIPDFIIHLHTVWMFTMFEELLRHSIAKQEMKAILHNYILFEIQGWRAIIRI